MRRRKQKTRRSLRRPVGVRQRSAFASQRSLGDPWAIAVSATPGPRSSVALPRTPGNAPARRRGGEAGPSFPGRARRPPSGCSAAFWQKGDPRALHGRRTYAAQVEEHGAACKEHDPSQAREALRRVGVLDPEVRRGRHGPDGERVAHGARRLARSTWRKTARAPIRRGLAGNRKNPICRGGGRHLLVPHGAVRKEPEHGSRGPHDRRAAVHET